jgi:hypothetical protein
MKNMARCNVQHFQQMNEETPDSFVVGFFLLLFSFLLATGASERLVEFVGCVSAPWKSR